MPFARNGLRCDCKSARRPDANRHAKLLNSWRGHSRTLVLQQLSKKDVMAGTSEPGHDEKTTIKRWERALKMLAASGV